MQPTHSKGSRGKNKKCKVGKSFVKDLAEPCREPAFSWVGYTCQADGHRHPCCLPTYQCDADTRNRLQRALQAIVTLSNHIPALVSGKVACFLHPGTSVRREL
jgi:hypothetical protein